ncbi:MAG: DoxX family protein [Planctomycetaceae bacterium]|nr:DoxX family protein [Planctomycetaceae bacterium]
MNGSKTQRISGWVLSFLLAAFLIVASAMGKFTEWEGKAEMFAQMGWAEDVMFRIGIVEVVVATLFLIPRTAFLGAILLSAYLGGAVATHVRVNDAFWFPIVMGIIAWIALGLRQPEIFRLALGQSGPAEAKPEQSI